jgi:hypothetical protein
VNVILLFTLIWAYYFELKMHIIEHSDLLATNPMPFPDGDLKMIYAKYLILFDDTIKSAENQITGKYSQIIFGIST